MTLTKKRTSFVRTLVMSSFFGALPFFVTGCLVSKSDSSELVLKGSSAESAEVVQLDPVFLSRQKQVESQFFGFDSVVQTEFGQVPLSSDEDDSEVSVTNPAPQAVAKSALEKIVRLSLAWPLNGSVSSPFGMRGGRLHAGIDLRASKGTPIRAAADGQILTSKRRGAYGNVVIVGHDNDHQTLYAHMTRFIVREGGYVHAGDVLGYVGRTGRATGYHLHFETRVAGGIPQDPLRFLPDGRAYKVGSIINEQPQQVVGVN